MLIGGATESDLWVVDVASGTHSRLTFGLRARQPTWTPDGTGITIGVRRAAGWALLNVRRDGGTPTALIETAHRAYPNAWSPDGRTLVYQEWRPNTGWDPPAYMAPEQLSLGLVHSKSDLYSLAVVAYETLTGVRPFRRSRLGALLQSIVADEAPRASAVNPALPQAVDLVLATALAKAPEKRYPDGRAFVTALAGAFGGAPRG